MLPRKLCNVARTRLQRRAANDPGFNAPKGTPFHAGPQHHRQHKPTVSFLRYQLYAGANRHEKCLLCQTRYANRNPVLLDSPDSFARKAQYGLDEGTQGKGRLGQLVNCSSSPLKFQDCTSGCFSSRRVAAAQRLLKDLPNSLSPTSRREDLYVEKQFFQPVCEKAYCP